MSLLIGAIVGLILGLTGAGGSIIAVPLLSLGLGLPLQQATGLALLAVFASASFGVMTRLGTRQVLWMPGLMLAFTGSLSAPLGRMLASHVPETILLPAFALLSIAISLRLWQQARNAPETTHVVRASADDDSDGQAALCRLNDWQPLRVGARCMVGMGSAGLGIGLLSGLFGVGGGFMIVPALMRLTGIGIRQAVGTSLVVISLVSLSGFASHVLLGSSDSLAIALPLASGGMLGMLTGNRLSARISGPRLQKLFALTVFAITLLMVLRPCLPALS